MALLGVLLTACAGGPANQTARALLDRAASADFPARYRFVDRPDAAGLTECLGRIATVRGAVDSDAGVAVLEDERGEPYAYLFDGRALIHERILTRWDLSTAWLEIDRDTPSPTLIALELTLGPDLASYVLERSLPTEPVRVASAVLRASSDMVKVATPSEEVTTIKVSLSSDELETVFEGEPLSPDETMEIEFDVVPTGLITRLAIRPQRPEPGIDGEEELGWQVAFSDLATSIDMDVAGSSESTNAASVTPPKTPTVYTRDECSIG